MQLNLQMLNTKKTIWYVFHKVRIFKELKGKTPENLYFALCRLRKYLNFL